MRKQHAKTIYCTLLCKNLVVLLCGPISINSVKVNLQMEKDWSFKMSYNSSNNKSYPQNTHTQTNITIFSLILTWEFGVWKFALKGFKGCEPLKKLH